MAAKGPRAAFETYTIYYGKDYPSSPFLTDGPYSAAFSENDRTGYTYLSLSYRDNYWYMCGRNLSAKELTNQYVNVSYVSDNSESYFIYSVCFPL